MRLVSVLTTAALTALLFPSTGCFTAAKQAFSEVQGAKAEIEPISAGSARGSATQIRFRPAHTEANMSNLTAAARAFDAAARKVEVEVNEGQSGAGLVEVDTKLLYAKGKALFGTGILVARVQAYQGGASVMDAFVRTETKSFRAGDIEDVVEAMAEEVAKYLTGRDKELIDLDNDKDKDSDND